MFLNLHVQQVSQPCLMTQWYIARRYPRPSFLSPAGWEPGVWLRLDHVRSILVASTICCSRNVDAVALGIHIV